MRYRLLKLELSRPLDPIQLDESEHGLGLIARVDGRLIGFHMEPCAPGEALDVRRLTAIIDTAFAQAALEARVASELEADPAAQPSLPGLTIAICTRDRAARLARLLASLVEPCARSPFASTEILVIDNAPPDGSTRDTVACFPGVRHVVEPKAGLNFARNAALKNARGALLAFLDDDVVIDRNWLNALADASRRAPEAGGFTGLVLPYRLDTQAQVLFERRGGFGRGFERREWHATSFRHALHPAGAGLFGAGCNMAFDVALLRRIGGFDEALDTGAPLPGGGDLDIFYRVNRAGRTMVYEPQYAVYHEHRETLPQLRRQYWTWGLGMMAFLVKAMRTDPGIAGRQRGMLRWWLIEQTRSIVKALVLAKALDLRLAFAELSGGVQGLLGEYDRSQRRIEAIRRSHA
jgi:GT2 family glycosyltransferase